MQSEAFVIRQATTDEQVDLVEHSIDLALETEAKVLDPGRVTDGVRHILDDPRVIALVACDGEGIVVGSLTLAGYEWSDWRAGWFAWATSGFITPAYRFRGIYKALWQKAALAARAAGALGIRTYVHWDNAASLLAHERLGFQHSSYVMMEMAFDQSGADPYRTATRSSNPVP